MGAGVTTAGRVRGAEPARTRRALALRVERRITAGIMAAHLIGVADVLLLLLFVLPMPPGAELRDHLTPNVAVFAVYLPFALAVGYGFGRRVGAVRMGWVLEDRDPDPEEAARVLRIPVRCFKMDAGLWLGAAVLFGIVNLPASPELGAHLAWTVVLGGVTVCAVAHLLLERELRPIMELALAAGPPARRAWPGVEGRLVLAWLLATGSPILGLITLGVVGLREEVAMGDLSRGVAVLGGLAFVIGLGVTVVVARSVAAPLTAMRRALGRVEAGDLATEVRVDDGSEVGLVQSGFNAMVAGLRERERMQDLYARQVGADVARVALADEPRLGGEVREVAVLFVDLIGSTRMAAEAPPERVVARLNRFFDVVLDVVAAHGGWVNKFEGDAALCVFGAPAPLEDAAGCALRAGRDLLASLSREVPWSDVGIGLSAGPAVAGWIGATQRFEFTVVGDPVNVAHRLCELAKQHPRRLLASEAILARAGSGERDRWALGDAVTLRGHARPTIVASPAG